MDDAVTFMLRDVALREHYSLSRFGQNEIHESLRFGRQILARPLDEVERSGQFVSAVLDVFGGRGSPSERERLDRIVERAERNIAQHIGIAGDLEHHVSGRILYRHPVGKFLKIFELAAIGVRYKVVESVSRARTLLSRHRVGHVSDRGTVGVKIVHLLHRHVGQRRLIVHDQHHSVVAYLDRLDGLLAVLQIAGSHTEVVLALLRILNAGAGIARRHQNAHVVRFLVLRSQFLDQRRYRRRPGHPDRRPGRTARRKASYAQNAYQRRNYQFRNSLHCFSSFEIAFIITRPPEILQHTHSQVSVKTS